MVFTDTRTVPPQRRTSTPARPRRGRGLNAALLAALVGLTVGVAAGRASQPDPATPPPQHALPEAEVAEPEPDEPRRIADGVGVGWTRTRTGAVAAATAYLAGLNSRGYVTDPDTRVRLLQRMVVPEQAPALLARAAQAAQPQPGSGSPLAAAFGPGSSTVWRVVPLGYRVASYGPDAAVVEVWHVHVSAGVGATPVPATAAWATTTVPLRWQGGDWRLDLAAAHTRAGPTPATPGAALSGDLDLVAAVRRLQEYRHVAG